MSMKNSNGTIGNRTRNLLVCSAVPQPTAPPRIPPFSYKSFNKQCCVARSAGSDVQKDHSAFIFKGQYPSLGCSIPEDGNTVASKFQKELTQ
jgi:hypothetical protein